MPNKTNSQIISWRAPEYVFFDKSHRWSIGLIIIAVLAIGFSLFLRDFMMTVTLIIIFFIAFIMGHRRPRTVTISLNEKGLNISGILYTYESTLRNFWIIYSPPHIKTLNFRTTNFLNRDITLQLEDQDPLIIRQFLLQYLPEDHNFEESYLDKLMRALRF